MDTPLAPLKSLLYLGMELMKKKLSVSNVHTKLKLAFFIIFNSFFKLYIYYSFDTGEYHESVGLVFKRVPQARE